MTTHADHDNHAAHTDTDATPERDETHEHGNHADGQHDHGQHDHADHIDQFRRRFWVALALTLPIVVWAPTIQSWFQYTAPEFAASDTMIMLLGTAVYLYGGWPFLTGGIREARSRAPGMMLLIAMAITVAYGASLATAFGLFDQEVWWELALLVTIMLLGHWIEMRAIGQAQGALSALAALLPDDAERVVSDGATERVPLHDVREGDVVLVRPGARVPADGEVVDGSADVDESMITGESNPVMRREGDRVVAGTIATDGHLRISVTATGDATTLAGIERMVADAQQSRSRAQALADRAAALLFYVAVATGAVTAAVWMALGAPDMAISRSVTVLVIACPHALGLAVPLVTSLSTAKAARAGILVKDRLALERMRTVDIVIFDKTGTLTQGAHAVTNVTTAAGTDEGTLLRLAAAVERDSEHPLARAIVSYAQEHTSDVPRASEVHMLTGRGVRGEAEGRVVAVGGPAMLQELRVDVPHDVSRVTDDWVARGDAVLHVVIDGAVAGAIGLADAVRDASRQAVEQLHEAGIRVAMVTGDAQHVAETVAKELGIDEVFAEVLPADKASAVADLQSRGHSVAMVGDGVNDAPALAHADVGIAIGAGTDVAIESAGIVLASDDPRGVVLTHRLSAATYRKMVQNLWWAAGYNIVAMPLAAGVLAPIGFILPMAVGAMLMSASTIVVALNAQLLRRVQLQVD